MIFNRWQCWILSWFKDFSGHSFYVEDVVGRGKKIKQEDGKEDEVLENLTGYVLHCSRCTKHNLFLTTESDLGPGDVPKFDSVRLPI